MSDKEFSARDFWEHKILGWETGRYSDPSKASTLVERWANRSSNSLRFRLKIAETILLPHVEGKKVVELGCGSGLLAQGIISAGAQSYLGIDIADAAIDQAVILAQTAGITANAEFRQGEIADLPSNKADIVFSLGLLDWLSDPELRTVFNHYEGADFLHAISERQLALSQLVHRLYCFVSYGYKNPDYVPRYFTVAEIQRYSDIQMNVYRDNRLSFGALLTTLPLPERG